MRAAFYYPWYPEQWTSAGSRYVPILGEYDSSKPEVISSHIDQMKFANIEAGIWSWWGKGELTDQRFTRALDQARDKNFKWCVYYELDWDGKASYYFRVKPDLSYLKKTYFNHPSYLKIQGRPVVFVYTPGGTAASVAKWVKARKEFNLYISVTDYPEWWNNNPLDSWHSYRPDLLGHSVYSGNKLYSVAISAGFWAAWEESPRLVRNFENWEIAVDLMSKSNADWQLLFWNEFGEGTAIEPSTARCQEYLCSDYLVTLHEKNNTGTIFT